MTAPGKGFEQKIRESSPGVPARRCEIRTRTGPPCQRPATHLSGEDAACHFHALVKKAVYGVSFQVRASGESRADPS